MFNQKGSALVIVLLLVVAIIFMGFLLTLKNKTTNLPPSPIPTTIPTLPILDKQDPTNFIIYKYLDRGGVLDAKPMGEIAVKVPSGTKITNQKPIQVARWGVEADIQIGDKSYNFISGANPAGGLCSWDDEQCHYTDEGIYRIWKDQNGILGISIGGLKVGDYSTGVIIINKSKPATYFNQAEIDQWKSIINSAKVYQSDLFDSCLLNNSCK